MKTLTADRATGTGRGRLPDFLIIGAMKAGTTTLYEDLRRHPDLFLPTEKEPHSLRSDDILRDGHLQAYRSLFDPATPNQLCGEASTTYTNRPTYEGVAHRARQLLGDEIKLVYIVRDPVERSLSQHRFLYHGGFISADINDIIHKNNTLIDYSCYAMQIDPWLSVFGSGALHVILFEDYIRDRTRELDKVCQFLRVARVGMRIDEERVCNPTSDKRALPPFWQRVAGSRSYQKVLRPLISGPVGTSKLGGLRRRLARKPLSEPPPATEKTRHYIADVVRRDALRFAEMTGADISRWESLKPCVA